MINKYEFPFLIYLNSDGTIGFSQNVYDYDTKKPDKIDLWVVNHKSQFEEVSRLHRLFLMNNVLEKIKPATLSKLRTGTQIIYLPRHLTNKADLLNQEIQFGFVTSIKRKDCIYCRYFSRFDLRVLRTLSCSEQSPLENLYLFNTVEKSFVRGWIKYIKQQQKDFLETIKSQEQPWVRLDR